MSPNVPARLCLTCDYYSSPECHTGECRIRAPGEGGWPDVRADEWCGEHEPSLAAWAEIERSRG